jgi:hypothetical protein
LSGVLFVLRLPMRVHFLLIAMFGLLGIACENDSRRCSAPAGCVSAERMDGGCACVEWETVSTESVALPFVVANVTYAPIGSASVFRYGFTGDPSMLPNSASSWGTTFRAVIRRPDGSDQTARVGTIESGGAAAFALTDTLLRLDSGGIWALTTDVDLTTSRADGIAVWVNPAVTVLTDYVGQKTVNWSSRPVCFWPGLDCKQAEVIAFSAALLRRDTSWGAAHDSYLDDIGPETRTALLAFDPRDAGGPTGAPRYQPLGEVLMDATPRQVDVTWQPCTDPAQFEVLAETTVPLRSGDAFVLQYGVQPDVACAPQHPGLLVGTATPGCSIGATVSVDRLSGSLMMQPSSPSGECISK